MTTVIDNCKFCRMRFLIIVAVIAVICVALYLFGTADDRRANREYKKQHKATPEERKELRNLQDLHDELLEWSLDNMDVEPNARIVYDIIRKNDKKELG